MATISEALAIAIQHHQAGRLQAAEQIYRQILQAEPNHADAWHLLGVIAHQAGKHGIAVEYIGRAIGLNGSAAGFHNNLGAAYCALGRIPEAIACYRRAVELKPDYAEAHDNLGDTLKGQGKLDEAVACYRRAVELKPDLAETHRNLGLAWKEQGELDEAIACYRRAVELKPDYAEAHYNLGNALRDQGKLDEAIACYRRALELRPSYVEAHNNAGNALKDLGNLDEAIACYRRALELRPDVAEAHSNLGLVLNDQGRWDEAIACYRRALELKPDYAEAHNHLGNALKDQGNLDDAVACYRRALELKPDYAEAHNNLGLAVKDQGKLDETLACYHRALELKPDYAEAHSNLGNALGDQGKPDEAVACYRRARELRPDLAWTHSNLLSALQYCPGVTPAALAEAHAEYDRRHAAPLRGAFAQQENVRDRHGRLRLGFVSPDLGRHPVGYFLVRVLENLRHQQHETICYSDRMAKDDLTHRLQAAATQWRDVRGVSDQRLAEQIRADRIDILFDLAGHTAHNRLLVFARKPAPVQVTWIGYEGTTGLAAMDYLLADRHVVPQGSQQYYREHVLRMPDGYLCYDPPASATPVGPPPSLTKGHATFGSFNNPAKITPEVVAVWAEILRRVPTARLVLKYQGLGDPTVRRRYLDLFAAHDLEPQRLELLPPSSYAEYLATYQQVDVALDPFPFSGSATTCEALWMGVPVITCPFETFASRHALSHLSNVGLTEMIAHNLDEYVELAVSLAGDLPRLAVLRAGLREQMAASPLCDGKRFAGNLASALHDAWEQRMG
jgi:predicted O-linked N-acetylglucosamine transferase (SPINDLY family)